MVKPLRVIAIDHVPNTEEVRGKSISLTLDNDKLCRPDSPLSYAATDIAEARIHT